MSIIQNFSVSAGDDDLIGLDISGVNLTGATVYWKCWATQFTVPQSTPVISKSSPAINGIDLTTMPLPTLTLTHTDTLGMLGNYYFETRVVDALGDVATVTQGLMTVTQSETVP